MELNLSTIAPSLYRLGVPHNADVAHPNEDAYLRLLAQILLKGKESDDRTGVGTIKMFGNQLEFDMRDGFPLLTTKTLHFKSILHELLWFLRGDTNIKYLQDNGVTIWDEWADENGDLGPVYGKQWRNWAGPLMECDGRYSGDCAQPAEFDDSNTFGGKVVETTYPSAYDSYVFHKPIDQIKEAYNTLKNNPDSRRIIVSAWNPADIDKMALPPCHMMFQFGTEVLSIAEKISYVHSHAPHLSGSAREEFERYYKSAKMPERRLNLKMYQRSADTFLGVPYNIASYAILLQLFAEKLNMAPGRLILTFGDVHLYKNHVDQAITQLSRTPCAPPSLHINKDILESHDIWDMPYEAFSLEGYNPQGVIKADVSV